VRTGQQRLRQPAAKTQWLYKTSYASAFHHVDIFNRD
jgi:hypothetical protein